MAALPVMLIIFEILPRLPAKAVAQLKVVCKDWKVFLSTPRFASIHSRRMHMLPNQKVLAIGRFSCFIHSLACESSEFILRKKIKVPFTNNPYNLTVLAGLDGLLCVCLRNTREMFIWNPLTELYMSLSNCDRQGFFKARCDAVGFCIDSQHEYKIVHMKRRRGEMAIHMYSISSGSWSMVTFLKKSPYRAESYSWSSGTTCGNCLYFMVCQWWLDGEKSIICFDVNSRKFRKISFPCDMGQPSAGNLVAARDQLLMFLTNDSFDRMVYVWRLEGDAWTKVFSDPQSLRVPMTLMSSITYVNANGTFALMTEWGELYQINVLPTGIDSFCPLSYSGSIAGAVYTETIVSPVPHVG